MGSPSQGAFAGLSVTEAIPCTDMRSELVLVVRVGVLLQQLAPSLQQPIIGHGISLVQPMPGLGHGTEVHTVSSILALGKRSTTP
ncbi:uncharacterized protein YALI1_A18466g [Yarrowia lipolytica]|uniref:Uncharacterized protein n=1 Tax=Yarrowia lipolytica TaxID=4952 RepID=A0A1D8N598_YARLL|nr:hypothetical protein YALI1_A18466g [Yarrowia lipolytica]